VVGGYSYSDVPDAGLAFSIVTEGDDRPPKPGWKNSPNRLGCPRAGHPKEHDIDAVIRDFVPGGKVRPAGGSRQTISAAAARRLHRCDARL
jgi:hypothetical protein